MDSQNKAKISYWLLLTSDGDLCTVRKKTGFENSVLSCAKDWMYWTKCLYNKKKYFFTLHEKWYKIYCPYQSADSCSFSSSFYHYS